MGLSFSQENRPRARGICGVWGVRHVWSPFQTWQAVGILGRSQPSPGGAGGGEQMGGSGPPSLGRGSTYPTQRAWSSRAAASCPPEGSLAGLTVTGKGRE